MECFALNNIYKINKLDIGNNLLWRQAGILEHGAADGADELLIHRALEPGHLVAHPPLLGSAPASSPERTTLWKQTTR